LETFLTIPLKNCKKTDKTIMKWASYFSLFLLLSCSHSPGSRLPAQVNSLSCLDAMKVVLKERKYQLQNRLISEAQAKNLNWEELQDDPAVLNLIGPELEGNRQKMALLSIAILKEEYPNESLDIIGQRFQALKRVCTGS
jgi:hypothetical protein